MTRRSQHSKRLLGICLGLVLGGITIIRSKKLPLDDVVAIDY